MKTLKERWLDLDSVTYDVAQRLFEEMQVCVEILHDGPRNEEGKLVMDYDLRQVAHRITTNRVILTKLFKYDSARQFCEAINKFEK